MYIAMSCVIGGLRREKTVLLDANNRGIISLHIHAVGSLSMMYALWHIYTKACLKRPLKNIQKILMTNVTLIKVESMEHSAIHLTCIKR